jgi:hypothetical protein
MCGDPIVLWPYTTLDHPRELLGHHTSTISTPYITLDHPGALLGHHTSTIQPREHLWYTTGTPQKWKKYHWWLFTRTLYLMCFLFSLCRLFGNSGTCSSCGQSIPASEFVMKAQGNVYHLKCFTCVSCHNQLVPGDRFGIINGSLFCEQDYPKVIKSSTTSVRGSHKVTKLRNTAMAGSVPVM